MAEIINLDDHRKSKAIKEFAIGHRIIFANYKHLGLFISELDASALSEYHRMEVGYKYGVLTKNPEQTLCDLATNEKKYDVLLQAAIMGGTPDLAIAALEMALDPEYTLEIKEIYNEEIVPLIDRFYKRCK